MKKLNENSTKIFIQLLKKLGAQENIKLKVDNYMPLSIELILDGIKTPFGKARWYSIAHHYEQNGDLMRDPEMGFLVVDNRTNESDLSLIAIYPQMYQQDNLGIYEESIKLDKCAVNGYIDKWQRAHCAFANLWLKNIKAQGFLR